MKLYASIVFLCCIVQIYGVKESKSDVNHLDIVLNHLKNEEWTAEEQPCYEKTLAILSNARNFTLWATWMWDSMQLPVGVLYGSRYQLGNYDECLQPPWRSTHAELRAQYCLADIKLASLKSERAVGDFDPTASAVGYIETPTRHGRDLTTVSWGVCMPSVCKPHSISKFLRILLRTSHLAAVTSHPTVTVDSCQLSGQHQYSSGFWYFLIMAALLFVIALFSTHYVGNNNAHSSAREIARAFCMRRNWHDLVKESQDDIRSMHGIKALSSILIVNYHYIYFVIAAAVSNGLVADEGLRFQFIVVNPPIIVDTFLVISGLIHMKALMSKWDNPESPLVVIWKRYIRFIGPFALTVFYASAVLPHTGSGPLWPRMSGHEQAVCAKNWWLSLLMISNYVNISEICYITTWQIPCDYQLAILGTALFTLGRRGRTGPACLIVAALVLLPGLVTYWNRYPATLYCDIESALNIRQHRLFTEVSTRSHLRAGAYLVGLAAGCLVALYKPSRYRNVLSKPRSMLVLVAAMITGMLTMVAGGMLYSRDYSALEAAVYAASHKIVWGLAISAVVLVCEYGHLPIISKFLSWGAFVPLSRLAYGLYLAHPAIMLRNSFAARSPHRYDLFTMISDSYGVMVIGYAASFCIWMLVQAPLINLSNLALYRKTMSTETMQQKGDINKKQT